MSIKILPSDTPVPDTYIYLREQQNHVEVVAQQGTLDQIILRIYSTGVYLVKHRAVGIQRTGEKVTINNSPLVSAQET